MLIIEALRKSLISAVQMSGCAYGLIENCSIRQKGAFAIYFGKGSSGKVKIVKFWKLMLRSRFSQMKMEKLLWKPIKSLLKCKKNIQILPVDIYLLEVRRPGVISWSFTIPIRPQLRTEKGGDADGKTVLFGLLSLHVVSMDALGQNIDNNVSYVVKVVLYFTLFVLVCSLCPLTTSMNWTINRCVTTVWSMFNQCWIIFKH